MRYAPGLATTGPANLRDLGGLRTVDGRRVRPGLLYRSEFPHWWVRERPTTSLRTVLDLRRPDEQALEDVDWQRWGVRRQEFSLGSGMVAFAEAHADAYLATGSAELARAVRVIVEPGALPLQFFCAAGKDRTGLMAIVVLAVLGVTHEDILADFHATGDGIARVLDRLAEHPYYEQLFADRPLETFVPRQDAADAVLAWLNTQGGAEAWATSEVASADVIDGFRRAVLTELDGPANSV